MPLTMPETELRALFARMGEGFFVAEMVRDPGREVLDFRYLEVNPAFEDLTGLRADQVVGRTGRALFPDLPDWLFETYARVAEGGAPARFQIEVPSLGEREYEVRAYPAWDSTGQRFAVLFLDVTERRNTEASLRERKARLRALFEGMFQFTGLLTPDGTLLEANQAALAFGGLTGEETIGLKFWDTGWWVGTPESAARLRAAVAEAAGGAFVRYEVEVRGAERNAVIDFSLRPVRDERGAVVFLVPEGRDITELKRAEAALAEKEGRLRLAVQGARLGVWEFDLPRDCWRLDARALAITGLDLPAETWVPASSPVLHAWFASIHPEDASRRAAAYERVLRQGGETFETEYRIPRPGHAWNWVAQQALVVERDTRTGAPLRLVGVARDVTEERDMQAELERLVVERTRELQEIQSRLAHAERMQALGQLAGGVAHDFNNVLQAVQGAAGLIERRPADPENVRRLARLAGEAAARGSAVTQRLLAFARRGDASARPMDVAALFGGLRDILRHTLGTGVVVRVEAPADLPAALADKAQLETVLVNLATNARDAMPGGGVLTFAAGTDIVERDGSGTAGGRPVPATLLAGCYVRLSVSDTGTGLPLDVLARATEPFFTTKGEGKGTGLGLAMARGFAEQSGGALHIESVPGRGTTVSLWFPCAGQAGASPLENTDDAAVEAVQQRRVLLVDDDPIVREVTSEQLETMGYVVLPAGSGPAALALLDAGTRPDIVISDLFMPGMDGVMLIREAHRRRPELPAILLTGFATNAAEIAVDGALSGSFSMLRKPVTAEQIAERVEALLANATAGDRT
ncbi:PAS domain-containing sensor histidine kinase [Muricoccus nepalensis]|uniref:PAS domain-containing sensor histidine kinase n=1 Tax=Muricoccus nepalensis TaxID=1854500 RepID=UPI00138705C3|nr:PAS domain-containing sensor histidine kinase [Roseomonas nepalensis]